jgi:hypothetical protein
MLKKAFVTGLAVFLIFSFLGCGSDSSTGSSSTLPTNTTGTDYTGAYDDFHNAALDNDFDTNHSTDYSWLFQNWLYNPIAFFEVYEDFKDNATYNPSESRWETTISNPFGSDPATVTIYAEYVEGNILRLHSTDDPAGQGLYIYPDEGIKIYLEPDGYIKFELYKENNYYYGFLRFNLNNDTSYPYIIKFKYEDASPCTYFDLYFFRYSGSTAVGDYPSIRVYSGTAEEWYTDRSNVATLWYEINWDDPTFTYTASD